jgi:hypothetical protein
MHVFSVDKSYELIVSGRISGREEVPLEYSVKLLTCILCSHSFFSGVCIVGKARTK